MSATKLNTLACMLMLLLPATVAADDLRIVKLEARPLSQLNIPRANHALFYANGELTVAGGHTEGFVPTPTAEYLKDGQWHLMQMVYTHDFGFHVPLSSGKVLLGGGCSDPIGIGQTYLAELYDPNTHSFKGFGSMENKRTLASGLEIDSGRVVIAGNWYHQDAIEVFDSQTHRFTNIREVSTQRAVPLIVQTAPDDALIFGSCNNRGDSILSAFVYQLKGDSVHIPLLETWHPSNTCITAGGIDKYSYLIPVYNHKGQMAIMQVNKGEFSLLPTTCPVPTKALGQSIEYLFNIVADRKAKRAYLFGVNGDFRENPSQPKQYFILAIDYGQLAAGKAASLTLYYTQPIDVGFCHSPILTPEGNLVTAGGILNNSNFTTSSDVWQFPVGAYQEESESTISPWLWITPLAMILIVLLCYLFISKRRPAIPSTLERNYNVPLMERITELMTSRQLYLNSELKVSDVADALGVHRNVVSDAINSQTNGTFSQYVSNFRIEHAKALLRQNPDMKLSSVSSASGFANEQTFFRTFKAITGKTPKEWIQSND